jgi:hypothetical protein
MGTTTTTFALNKPTVGGDDNAWGTELNANLDKLDDLLDGTLSIAPNLVGWEVGGVAVTASAAELNLLDGVTASTAELNILDGVTASTAEINLLDGVTYTLTDLNSLTASIAELNVLDGITATTAELNVLDGIAGIASQVEAEAGTATDKLMTPERTKQAIDALASASSIVLLGTVNTTSGSTVTLSGLDLTGYKQVQAWLNGISATAAAIFSVGGIGITSIGSAAGNASGLLTVDLATSIGVAIGSTAFDARASTVTNASTSISITTSAGTFDAGSVRIYGVK